MSFQNSEKATVSGRPAEEPITSPVPNLEKRSDGQHVDHWILSENERAKGFVRPVRTSYVHIGPEKPKYALRDLSEEENQRYSQFKYVKFEQYPDSDSVVGKYWTQEQLDRKGCRTSTSMPQAIAETYARDPSFYGRTFCCNCNGYFQVGPDGEFIWDDGSKVGT